MLLDIGTLRTVLTEAAEDLGLSGDTPVTELAVFRFCIVDLDGVSVVLVLRTEERVEGEGVSFESGLEVVEKFGRRGEVVAREVVDNVLRATERIEAPEDVT